MPIEFGSLPPNPSLGSTGVATMHGDAASTDTTPFAGPGETSVHVLRRRMWAACPTILIGTDGLLVALCTRMRDRRPVVRLLDPATAKTLAETVLERGSLLGGCYGYLDQDNQAVLVDGHDDLLRIAHHRDSQNRWQMVVTDRIALRPAIRHGNGRSGSGHVVAIMPDWEGRVWFTTEGGIVGTIDPATRRVRAKALPDGERIHKSLSIAPPALAAVVSNHAFYLLGAGSSGELSVLWRYVYDRGPARKPGQLDWGCGTTPTFFGPETGAEYVAITDNSQPLEHLLVFDLRPLTNALGPRLVRAVPLFRPGNSGTGDSPIGIGRSVFVTSTYGYRYPATPEGAPPSQPTKAPFPGGMARVDVDRDGTGCKVVWTAALRCASTPRFSIPDHRIYTTTLRSCWGHRHNELVSKVYYSVIDPEDGSEIYRQYLGTSPPYNPLQIAPTISPAGVMYQGTLAGLVRIAGSSARTAAPSHPSGRHRSR